MSLQLQHLLCSMMMAPYRRVLEYELAATAPAVLNDDGSIRKGCWSMGLQLHHLLCSMMMA